jgi:hypothetical protein
MKNYDVFYPEVLPEVPGCPAALALQAIRNTVIEFCEKSLIHQVTQDPLTLLPNLSDYDLDPPSKQQRVQKIMRVWFKGAEIGPVAPDDVATPDVYAANIPGYTPTKGPTQGYTQKEFGTVSFMPIPDQRYVNAITMRVALVPTRDSTSFEDFLFEQWGEFIACGAKARLMLNPGKPYTNVEAATVNQGRYMTALNDARQRAIRGNVRSDLMVRMRKP